ncbi:unnamed protein product [Absidia cylindrospora]
MISNGLELEKGTERYQFRTIQDLERALDELKHLGIMDLKATIMNTNNPETPTIVNKYIAENNNNNIIGGKQPLQPQQQQEEEELQQPPSPQPQQKEESEEQVSTATQSYNTEHSEQASINVSYPSSVSRFYVDGFDITLALYKIQQHILNHTTENKFTCYCHPMSPEDA